MDEKENQFVDNANERDVDRLDIFKKIKTEDEETLGILHKKVSK